MLRAAKKLITKVLCPNMKKSRNQRRLVIVVALVGVYFLGRHSSSLGMSHSGEEEKRFLRGPYRYRLHSQHKDTEHKETAYIVEPVDQQRNAKQLKGIDSDSANTKSADEVLQEIAETVANIVRDDEDVTIDDYNDSLDIHVDYHEDYSEEKQIATKVTNNMKDTESNKESDDQDKDLIKGIDNNTGGSQISSQPTTKLPSSESPTKSQSMVDHSNKVIDTGNDTKYTEPKPSRTRNQNVKGSNPAKPVDKANKNVAVNTVKPKPTVIVSKPPAPPKAATTQGSSRKYVTTTSTVQPSKSANSRFAGGIKIQEILKDNKLFVLKSKENVEDQFLRILRTLPYSSLLKRAAAGTTLSPDNNTYDTPNNLGYNKELSDSLPLLRDLPDNRDVRCRTQHSTSNELAVSIISVVHSESLSVVMKMLLSVLHRTPSQILKDIHLVMDVPAWDKGELILFNSITAKFSKVKIINAGPSMGLADCMNTAARRATGQVLAFVSPRIEFTSSWHAPLLAWLSENPNDMVVPVIDMIHYKTLEYSKSAPTVQVRGGFTWALTFRWKEIPNEEKQRRQNLPIELRTPVYNGAIMLVRRAHYNILTGANQAIAGFDEKGVALDLSMKQWMCGGMLQTIPCSRVGYMYSMESSVNIEQLKNRQIIAESLMDDYRKHFYGMHTHLDKNEILQTYGAHIQTTKDLRKKLECNSFKWYLDEVYYDKKEPRADSKFAGLITQTRGAKLCVDSGSYVVGRPAFCKACYNGSFTQRFELDMNGMLTFDEDLILGQRKLKPYPGDPVEVLKKRTMSNKQEWMLMGKFSHLVHLSSGLCMNCDKGKLTLAKCSSSSLDTKQTWKFDWRRTTQYISRGIK